MTTPAGSNRDRPDRRPWTLVPPSQRIPAGRPSGLSRLLYHRPGRQERELLAAREVATGEAREAAFADHASYLANVWMPAHPVRAALESRLQDYQDRRCDPGRDAGQPEPGA
jgi:hypothetical protein